MLAFTFYYPIKFMLVIPLIDLYILTAFPVRIYMSADSAVANTIGGNYFRDTPTAHLAFSLVALRSLFRGKHQFNGSCWRQKENE